MNYYIITMDQPQKTIKEERGLMIAKEGAISKVADNIWRVHSQTRKNRVYTIKLTAEGASCSCADWDRYQTKCKHIYALDYKMRNSPEDLQEKSLPEIPKETYSQNWKNYNFSQTIEKKELMRLLADVVLSIEQDKYQFGRPKALINDILYAMIFKVYSGVSGRRFTSDLAIAMEKNYVHNKISYNTIFKYFQSKELTNYLIELVKLTASPLSTVEKDFAIDSTGFGTSQFQRWFSYKHQRDVRSKKWVKCHFVCGVKTNIVTAVKMTTEFDADSPQFKELVKDTNERFDMNEISADKAYSSRENHNIAEELGAKAFIPFKKNATGGTRGSIAWKKAYHYFMTNYDEFNEHYHKRSNVETTVHMIKSKFGDCVKSKVWSAQVNEVLCKIICHNICVIIHEMQELGINPNFSMPINSAVCL